MPENIQAQLWEIIPTVIYFVVGVILFGFSVWLMSKVTPFCIRKEIEEDQNTALGGYHGVSTNRAGDHTGSGYQVVIEGNQVDQFDKANSADDSKLPGGTLLFAVFVIAVCGLIYELIAGALSSYLLGDSVTQFSLVIGIFLSSMGLGSFLSRFFKEHLVEKLIGVELAVGRFGGLTALAGFVAFALTPFYVEILLSLVAVAGILVGLEIPLVIRILKTRNELRVNLANVMAADYSGALVASLLFPFLLVPYLGIVQAGLVIGLVNVAVAIVLMKVMPAQNNLSRTRLKWTAGGSVLLLAGTLFYSSTLVTAMEGRIYQDEIIFAADTRYQRVVVTRWRDDIRLFLNGHLQFSSVDEYRYHESLVHPAMSTAQHERVLVLGGGDGMTLREVLRYPNVKHVVLVDLDVDVTNLFTSNELLASLNDNAFNDPRVTTIHEDAMNYLRQCDDKFDIVLADLPDPSTAGLAKLYSTTFYGLIGQVLNPNGKFATQATSPFRSREAFWCIAQSIATIPSSAGDGKRFAIDPYHTYIPTFGTWGFVLAGRQPVNLQEASLPESLKYVSDKMLASMFHFPDDIAKVETKVSTLNEPVVTRLYVHGYNKYLD